MDTIVSPVLGENFTTTVISTMKTINFLIQSLPIPTTFLDLKKYILTLPPIQFILSLLILTFFFIGIILFLTNFFFGPKNHHQSKIFINDFVVFTDFPKEWTTTLAEWKNRQIKIFKHDPDAIEFTHKLLQRSGISGDDQYLSPGLITDPPDFTIASARYEAEVVMFSCVERLLSRNNLSPRDIDILVVNCSLFNPTPSLCAMIINKFKFREDIITYNLSGMGCSASPLSVQLASLNLKLNSKKNPLAIVVSLECLSSHLYNGSQREFLLQNALFRMNGAAVLLSRDSVSVLNRPAPKWRIDQLERVHLGASDDAFQAIHLDNDKENYLGVRLSKELIREAGRGVALNLSILGPKILPYSELLKTGLRMGWRAISNSIFTKSSKIVLTPRPPSQQQPSDNKNAINTSGTQTNTQQSPSIQQRIENKKEKDDGPIIPNFKTCVKYWLIHAGGKAIITGIKDSLNLTEEDVKESRDVLFKYGNTSSASIWYELEEVEKQHTVKNGETALAIALGSGVKVQSMFLTSVNRRD